MKKRISFILCTVVLCVAMTSCGILSSMPAVTTDRLRLPPEPQTEGSAFMGTYTLEETFSKADAVIIATFTGGQTLAYENPQDPEYVDYYYEYAFEVTEWIRGSTPKELFILQYKEGYSQESYYYDHQLEEGREYLIPLSPHYRYGTEDGRGFCANCVIDLDDPQKSAINGESNMDKYTELSWEGVAREQILTYVQSLITPRHTRSLEELVRSAEYVLEVTVDKKTAERLTYYSVRETFECSITDVLKTSVDPYCKLPPEEQKLKDKMTIHFPYQAVNEGDTVILLVQHLDFGNECQWFLDVTYADETGVYSLRQKDEILSYMD